MQRTIAFGLTIVLTVLIAGPAAAQDRLIGQFEKWEAFEGRIAGKKACWVASKPTETKPDGIKRDPASILITWWPARKIRGQLKLNAGFPFRKNSRVTLKFVRTTHTLWTDGETAWAEDGKQDRAIMADMKKGKSVTVTGTSTRGTVVIDTYSLDGISAAIEAATKACGA